MRVRVKAFVGAFLAVSGSALALLATLVAMVAVLPFAVANEVYERLKGPRSL